MLMLRLMLLMNLSGKIKKAVVHIEIGVFVTSLSVLPGIFVGSHWLSNQETIDSSS